jgi:hypothetical protein
MSTRKFIVSDGKRNPSYQLEIEELTLMFLDTLMAELNAGTATESNEFNYADYFECKQYKHTDMQICKR